MSTVIKLKKSETALSKPSTSDLVAGEVAINALDQRIFVRDSNSNIITIGEAGGKRHESATVEHAVTVATKDSKHRYNGTGSSSGYKIDGTFSPTLELVPGNTYKFTQEDSSNSGHPLRFYYEADKTTSFTTGVTTSGTPGNSGAYTQIVVSDTTPAVLHYQCSNHGYMGNQVVIGTRNLTGFDTADLTEGTNLYYTDARFDTRLGTKDTDDLTEGTNLYYTDARVLTKINATSIDALSDVDTTTVSPSTGQALVWDGSQWEPGTVGGQITVQDEGSALSTSATTINFVGSGVTASGTGSTKTITISGGGGGGGIALSDISVGSEATASGDGGLAYNNSSGVFTYTPPTLSGIGGDTDDLTEGSTNLYFTNARIDSHLNQSTASTNQVLSWNGSDYAWVNQSGGGGGSGNAFTNFAVSGQSTVQADSSTDTLTLVGAGLNTITTNASTDTITIGTPTGIPFTKEDGTSTSLNMSVVAGTLSSAVSSLYIPFTKEDGSSVTTLVMS